MSIWDFADDLVLLTPNFPVQKYGSVEIFWVTWVTSRERFGDGIVLRELIPWGRLVQAKGQAVIHFLETNLFVGLI